MAKAVVLTYTEGDGSFTRCRVGPRKTGLCTGLTRMLENWLARFLGATGVAPNYRSPRRKVCEVMKHTPMLLVVSCILLVNAVARSAEDDSPSPSARPRVYSDKNGYFVAAVPEGWSIREYPEETIRSKVAFHSPREDRVYIRIISGPNPEDPYTLDDLLAESKEKIRTIFKRRWPSGSFTASKEKIADREAVVSRWSTERSEQEIVTFVTETTWYQVALGANGPQQLRSNRPTFQAFLTNFTFPEKGKKFSEDERRAAIVAKYTRLAKLHDEMGRKSEAILFLDEALSLEPDNKELLEYKSTLQGAR